ncbi:sensor histidine kinase [Actinomadura sp. 7K507]|uniref:sensor histidine kinase n=1 Tax=Actinomadura sp. 7K507 TaxID=2530365 RepID=UPI00104E5E33|nr:sensor histidine kinase [Actinomadura sp. 7K507]TDC84790.1 sensor histidine kinase [Actinomadura sp. 7K507]
MDLQPRLGDRVRALHRWYVAVWVLFGLCPPALAVHDRPAATLYPALALLAVLALSHALVRVTGPYAFLCVLALGVGGMSFLLGGGAAMFIVSLPLFWIHSRSPRYAVAFIGAAAALTLAGTVREGGEALTGNAVFTLIGAAAGILLGLWMHRVLDQRDERARRLAAELASTQRELAEAYQRQGAAEERERLAREIHDTLAQGFASIVVLAEAARTDPAKLVSIERTARENLAEARALVGSAPSPSGGPPRADMTIARTLRRTLDRFAEDTGIALHTELPDVRCDQPTRIALLRCTQESLANVRKHAAAGTVGVVLTRHPHGIELEITDDGRGFAVGEARGFGLDGMRRRLAEFGGELTVTSSPGEGTRVLALLPADPE